MATIVRDTTKNKFYVLVGAGYGSAKTAMNNPLFPSRIATSSETEMVAVANPDGEISWLPSYQLAVVSVDGVSCKELLRNARAQHVVGNGAAIGSSP